MIAIKFQNNFYFTYKIFITEIFIWYCRLSTSISYIIIVFQHNEIVTSLLWLMGVKKERGISYNAAAIMEYRSKPEPGVRLIFSEPNEVDPKKFNSRIETMPFCNGNEWCSLNFFQDGVNNSTIADYKKACEYPVCFCTKSSKNSSK